MTLYNTINLDLANFIADTKAHLKLNKLDDVSGRPPYLELGDAEVLSEQIPSLTTALASHNLSIKKISLYTIWNHPVASYLSSPYIVIPFENFQSMNLVFHNLNDGASSKLSPAANYPYYLISDTTVSNTVGLETNTAYIINSNVIHSFQYSKSFPYFRADFGSFLVAAVNEDLSSYFTS